MKRGSIMLNLEQQRKARYPMFVLLGLMKCRNLIDESRSLETIPQDKKIHGCCGSKEKADSSYLPFPESDWADR
jgi:hypothetical protein